jgi:hypothetical protein
LPENVIGLLPGLDLDSCLRSCSAPLFWSLQWFRIRAGLEDKKREAGRLFFADDELSVVELMKLR